MATEKSCNRSSTPIHVRSRLCNSHRLTLVVFPPENGICRMLERDPKPIRQGICDSESDVVTRIFVLRARISETNDQQRRGSHYGATFVCRQKKKGDPWRSPFLVQAMSVERFPATARRYSSTSSSPSSAGASPSSPSAVSTASPSSAISSSVSSSSSSSSSAVGVGAVSM